MDRETLSAALFESVRETLETMAFAEVRPYEEDTDSQMDIDVDFVWGKVGIDCVHDMNAIDFCLPYEFASEMAETMYAGMIEIEKKAVMDTVKELTNTLAGSFLLSFGEKAGKFTLSVPQSGESKPIPPKGCIICNCVVDEIHSVRAILYFD